MKRFFLFLVIAGTSLGCSNDETLSGAISPKDLNSVTAKAEVAGLCPDGYAPQWIIHNTLALFKKDSDCATGFGLCFGGHITINLECRKILLVPDSGGAAAKYFPADDSMDLVIDYIDPYNARVWVDSAAASSPSHSSSDFNSIDVGNLVLSTGATLKAGVYTKHVSGTKFYYDVPFL